MDLFKKSTPLLRKELAISKCTYFHLAHSKMFLKFQCIQKQHFSTNYSTISFNNHNYYHLFLLIITLTFLGDT